MTAISPQILSATNMASPFISTKERTNFARMCWIVVDVFRDILWRVLTDVISPADLPNKVQTNQHKLGNLDKDIRSWLCNSSSAAPIVPASKDFDVTSLYTLIRNLCSLPIPTNGWGQHPPSVGRNINDEVERVRVFRNAVYGHAKEAYVNSTDYSSLCRDMKMFIMSIEGFLGGNCDFAGRIDSILTCSMDKALQDSYTEKMQEIAKLSDDMVIAKQVIDGIGKDLRDYVCKAGAETVERRKTEDSLKRDVETLKDRLDGMDKDDIAVIKQKIVDIVKYLGDHVYKAGAETVERRKTEDSVKRDMEILKSRLDSLEKNLMIKKVQTKIQQARAQATRPDSLGN